MKEQIGKIAKLVIRARAHSYAFANADGRNYSFSIPDINEANRYRVGTEVVFTPARRKR